MNPVNGPLCLKLTFVTWTVRTESEILTPKSVFTLLVKPNLAVWIEEEFCVKDGDHDKNNLPFTWLSSRPLICEMHSELPLSAPVKLGLVHVWSNHWSVMGFFFTKSLSLVACPFFQPFSTPSNNFRGVLAIALRRHSPWAGWSGITKGEPWRCFVGS